MFPREPLCERIRALLGYLLQAAAWHQAVLQNSPPAYKAFYDKYSSSPYALSALKLQSQPKALPLLQPTHLIVPQKLEPTLTVSGTPKYNLNVRHVGSVAPVHPPVPDSNPSKFVTPPPQGSAVANGGKTGPGETVDTAVSIKELAVERKGDGFPVKGDVPGGAGDRPHGKGDRLPIHIIDQPIETRPPPPIDTHAGGIGKFNGPAPTRGRFAPGHAGGGYGHG
jgi:hypothetical protein